MSSQKLVRKPVDICTLELTNTYGCLLYSLHLFSKLFTVMHLCQLLCRVVPNHITAVGPSNTTGFVSCLGKYQPPAQYLHDCRLEAATEKGVKVELPPNPFVIKV